MHRVDGPGHVSNAFTDGDPATSVPATEVTDDWLNAVQEEVAYVIEQSGTALNKADNTQLRTAIVSMIGIAESGIVINPATFEGTVANGDVVYYDSTNSRYAKAIADGTAKQMAIGIADVTNTKVFAYGEAAGLLSGLTAGSRYYLSDVTAGALVTTAPAEVVVVGIAKSATSMHISIDSTGSTATDASETVKGLIELATIAEVIAGSDALRAITPATLKALLEQYDFSNSGDTVDSVNRTTSSTVYVDTGVSITGTLRNAGKKFRITCSGMVGAVEYLDFWLTLRRDVTDLTPAGSDCIIGGRPAAAGYPEAFAFTFDDAPGDTNPHTYKLYWKVSRSTAHLGRRSASTSLDVPTIMTLEEV